MLFVEGQADILTPRERAILTFGCCQQENAREHSRTDSWSADRSSHQVSELGAKKMRVEDDGGQLCKHAQGFQDELAIPSGYEEFPRQQFTGDPCCK